MKKILFFALVAASLTSCSSDSETPQAPVASKQPIVLGTGMPTMRSNSQTLQATELADQTTVGVYIYFNGETTTNATYTYGYKNIAYKVSGTDGDLAIVTSTDQPYYPDVKTQNVDIYAFAPQVYSGTAELNTLTAVNDVFATKADQTAEADYRASDFVWGKKANVAAPSTTSTKQEITMDHMLSKVNINIAAGDGVTLSRLAGATIKLNGVKLKGTVNFTTGAVTLDTDASNTATAVTLTTSTADQGKLADTTTDCYTSSAVIIPQDIDAADDFIEIKLSNNSVYKWKTTATTPFAAKTKYTFDITLSVAGIQLTTTVNNWTDGGTTPGTAE